MRPSSPEPPIGAKLERTLSPGAVEARKRAATEHREAARAQRQLEQELEQEAVLQRKLDSVNAAVLAAAPTGSSLAPAEGNDERTQSTTHADGHSQQAPSPQTQDRLRNRLRSLGQEELQLVARLEAVRMEQKEITGQLRQIPVDTSVSHDRLRNSSTSEKVHWCSEHSESSDDNEAKEQNDTDDDEADEKDELHEPQNLNAPQMTMRVRVVAPSDAHPASDTGSHEETSDSSVVSDDVSESSSEGEGADAASSVREDSEQVEVVRSKAEEPEEPVSHVGVWQPNDDFADLHALSIQSDSDDSASDSASDSDEEPAQVPIEINFYDEKVEILRLIGEDRVVATWLYGEIASWNIGRVDGSFAFVIKSHRLKIFGGKFHIKQCEPLQLQATLTAKINRIIAARERAQHERKMVANLVELGGRKFRGSQLSNEQASAALKAAGGSFLVAASKLGLHLWPLAIEQRQPVGLPNRCNDCFWLSAFQCLRHTPRFAEAVCGLVATRGQRPAGSLLAATSNLLLLMDRVYGRGQECVPYRSAEVREFIRLCAAELPALDQTAYGLRPLLQLEDRRQRQQDGSEFLAQLLDQISRPSLPTSVAASEDGVLKDVTDSAATSDASFEAHAAAWQSDPASAGRLAQLARELKSAGRREDWEAVHCLICEFAERQWCIARAVGRRMHPAIGSLFEGQKISVMQCTTKGCGHYSASSADPCIMEEARVRPPKIKSSFFFSTVTSADNDLVTLLKNVTQPDRPDGYKCDGCGRTNTTNFRSGFHRLPTIYIVHLNRTQMDGSRCNVAVDFPDELNLKFALLYNRTSSRPYTSDLPPFNPNPYSRPASPTSRSGHRYTLFAVTFHQGASARSGHYFACIRAGVGVGGRTPPPQFEVVRGPLPVGDGIDSDKCSIITRLECGAVITPAVTNQNSANAQEDSTLQTWLSADGTRRHTRLRTEIGWVTLDSSKLPRRKGDDAKKKLFCRRVPEWRLINDDEVSESCPPQEYEHGPARGPKASLLFYVKQDS